MIVRELSVKRDLPHGFQLLLAPVGIIGLFYFGIRHGEGLEDEGVVGHWLGVVLDAWRSSPSPMHEDSRVVDEAAALPWDYGHMVTAL